MVGIHQRIFSPAQSQSIVTTGHPRRDGSPNSGSPVSGTSSLAKVAIAQVYLLLGTIREDKDRSKWELQAEQLRKLVVENGMEVFQKYFIRLVVGNAPTIFPGINRPVTNQSTYQLLVNEIRQISQDVSQAGKIAEAIETANEDLFRDFDLSTFMDHFKLDPVDKTILALGFKLSSRPDLRTKADAILSTNFQHFINYLARPESRNGTKLDSEFLATIIDRFIQYHPPSYTTDAHADLTNAVYEGYEPAYPPSNISSALYMGDLILNAERGPTTFLYQIKRLGSNCTSDEESCYRALRNMPNTRIDEEAVSAAILYTAISRTPRFSTSILVSALRRLVPRTFKWSLVIAAFDKRQLRVSRSQFLAIYHALRPLVEDAREDFFDIERLWSGVWSFRDTQLSFVIAFLESGDELDISTVPDIKKSFTLDMYNNSQESLIDRARVALRHPLSCVSCIRSIFQTALDSRESSELPEAKRLLDILKPDLDIFTISAVGAVIVDSSNHWHPFAEDIIFQVFITFLVKEHEHYVFALQSLWLLDDTWVTDRFEKIHALYPLELPKILEHAVEHNWLRDLMRRPPTGFTLDLTAMAHRYSYIDTPALKTLLAELDKTFPAALHFSLNKFLAIKSNHEVTHREGQELISHWLSANTVFVFLEYLTDILSTARSEEFMLTQRKCLGAYPRIVNYNCNDILNAIIDMNGLNGNTLPQEAYAAMERHYKAMYAGSVPVRTVLDALKDYKSSDVPINQDIFACMISGLFDEYYAYQTYPIEALKTTASLFGGIVQGKLLPDLTQRIALGMIHDAVRDSPPDNNMYKFGYQVLLFNLEHFDGWPALCRQLIQVPALRGTEVHGKAQQVVHEHDLMDEISAPNGTNGGSLLNEIEEAIPSRPPFKSIRVDMPNDRQDPPEDVQEKVLFVLNNVTDQNLKSKFNELKLVLEADYQAWFANHLVEQRAKTQQNYHQLYLSLVAQYDSASLWSEILRETYVSVARMLNAESTEKQATERTLLKNLGAWLGLITLARGQPLRHKNIAFKQLLHEGHHTKRLPVVLPFVCKVLAEAKGSLIFHAENPYILDMLRCLAELYQTNLKLNLKFEIEVLFGHLGVVLGDVEPGSDLETSFEHEDLVESILPGDLNDRYDAVSMSGVVGGVASGRFSSQDIIDRIPDLTGHLQFPPVNDMVDTLRFQEVVKEATNRAIIDIIAPVVERSVTIAAISTKEMIKKDFATEGDDNRLRMAAINMVKRTAGSLALVTSKEPLRASMSNYIRQMSLNVGLALPEGLIILGVNANLDLACEVVEKRAEERAIPEIEEMIETELISARRDHRARATGHPFVDHNVLSRWAMTIASPYKLSVGHGLNQDQMAIYDEFAKVPRIVAAAPSHGQSTSDVSRSINSDMLHDGFGNGPHMSQALDNNSLSHLALQQSYAQTPLSMSNGRPASIDIDQFNTRAVELLDNIVKLATDTTEDHLDDLIPLRTEHPVLKLIESLLRMLIESTQYSGIGDNTCMYTIRQACERLFEKTTDSLTIEILLYLTVELTKVSARLHNVLIMTIAHQKDEGLLNIVLVDNLLERDLVDTDRLDAIVSRKLLEHSEDALDFFSSLMRQVLFTDRPRVLRANFAKSVDALHQWVREGSSPESATRLVQDFSTHDLMAPLVAEFADHTTSLEQTDYIFNEWVSLCARPDVPQTALAAFIHQLHVGQLTTAESMWSFLRIILEHCIENHEHIAESSMPTMTIAYEPIDALALFIVWLVKQQSQRGDRVKNNPTAFIASILAFIVLNLNHHHAIRGDNFNQKAFFRLFSTMLIRFKDYRSDLGEDVYQGIVDEFANIFHTIMPSKYSSFAFAWMSLMSHRDLVSNYLDRDIEACGRYVRLIVDLLSFTSEITKPLHPGRIAHEICGSASKIMVALNHDMPHVLAANHTVLCQSLTMSSLRQLQNLILAASPTPIPQPDTIQLGLKLDRVEGIRNPPVIANLQALEAPIHTADLQDVIDQALQHGPSEDAVAHVARAIQRVNVNLTAVCYSRVNVDVPLIEALVLYIGVRAVTKTLSKSGAVYVPASPDAALLSMLIHELSPEARYYLLNAMFSQLRYVNAHTNYFSQALLDMFGTADCDAEEMDIKEQIMRVLLERCSSQWPHPWGVVVFAMELMKNDKYMLFDLPFIKNDFTIAETLGTLTLRL